MNKEAITKEEALEELHRLTFNLDFEEGTSEDESDRVVEALNMAIQALEAIEKIKTEIKNYLEDEKYSDDGISDVGIGLELALEIIDKHIRGYTE